MRKYEKPVMQVERYTAKNAVATGCYLVTTTTIKAQTVNCIINGYENVFDQDQSGSSCQHDASSGALGTYNGDYYFVWYDGSVQSQPTKEQTAKLTAIENAVMGANNKAAGNPGWHAGTVTATQYKEMNSTS